MKKILLFLTLTFIVGCKDSTPTISSGSIPNLNFENGFNQITIYKNKLMVFNFSCHPQMSSFSFENENGPLSLDEVLLEESDLDCSDQKGKLYLRGEVSQNNFLLIKNSLGSISQIFFQDPPITDYPTSYASSIILDEDITVSEALVSKRGDGTSLSFFIKTQPTKGSISLDETSGQFIYTPNPNYNGQDSFSFYAKNNTGDSEEAEVLLTINPVNDKPVVEEQEVAVQEDTATSVKLEGEDIDGDSLSFYVVDNPTHGTLYGSGSNLVYMPNLNYNGSDSFTYKAWDGNLFSEIKTINLTISPVNDAPKAYNQDVFVDEDTSTVITLLGSDVEGDTLTYELVSTPSKGEISGELPNLTYTPTANSKGSDEFYYRVSDGNSYSSVKAVYIYINPVNDLPTGSDNSLTLSEDSSISFNLHGEDIDGDTLNFRIVEGPTHGVITQNSSNITYYPDNDYNGSDYLSYVVNDGNEDSSIYVIDLTINAINDNPVAYSDNYRIYQEEAKVFSLRGEDIEGDNLTYIIVSSPSSGTLVESASLDGQNYTYTPNMSFVGEDSFTYKIFDGELYSPEKSITFTVLATENGSRECTLVDTLGNIIGLGVRTSSDGGTTWSECSYTECMEGYSLINNSCQTLEMESIHSEFFMAHKDLVNNTNCTAGGTNCTYVGDKKKVNLENESSCSNLELKDSLNLFNWDCKEEGGQVNFYSRLNVAQRKVLTKIIDKSSSSLKFKTLKLTLTGGGSQTPTESVALTPWSDTIDWAQGVLSKQNTVYVLPTGYNRSITITNSNISLVGEYMIDQGSVNTLSCMGDKRCHIQALNEKFLYFELTTKPNFTGSENRGVDPAVGLFLSQVKNYYIMDSTFQFLQTGVQTLLSNKGVVYRSTFLNNETGAMIDGDENMISRSIAMNTNTGFSLKGEDNTVMALSVLNSKDGIKGSGVNNLIANSYFYNNKTSLFLKDFSNGLISNLTSMNVEETHIKEFQAINNNFSMYFNFNDNMSGYSENCLSDIIGGEIADDCSSDWTSYNFNFVEGQDLFDVDVKTRGQYMNTSMDQYTKVYLPSTLSMTYKGTYQLSNQDQDFMVYEMMLPSYNENDFKMKGMNMTVNPSMEESMSQGQNCIDRVYQKMEGKNALALAVEIPFSGGNFNGLCEEGENCEYLHEYGISLNQEAMDKKQEMFCNYNPQAGELQNIKIYQTQ